MKINQAIEIRHAARSPVHRDRLHSVVIVTGIVATHVIAIEQVHDYALDLKNFHKGSHSLSIVPLLVATKAGTTDSQKLRWAADCVSEPIMTNAEELKFILEDIVKNADGRAIDFDEWLTSGYQPTPTIVEAAQALYQSHSVEEITRSDAGAQNLGHTSNCIAEIIERSKASRRKSICIVTGVPGAGKTLAGLNIATTRAQEHSDEHADRHPAANHGRARRTTACHPRDIRVRNR